MKKTLPVLLTGLLLSTTLFGQTNLMSASGDLTYTQVADSIFSPISKSQVTTGILYDRVTPFAGLHAFKNNGSGFPTFGRLETLLFIRDFNNIILPVNAIRIPNQCFYTNCLWKDNGIHLQF